MKKVAIDHLKLYSKKCDEPVRIAFLTDIHNRCGNEAGNLIFSMLEEEHPDLILCGGDSIVARPDHEVEPALGFLKMLSDTWPVFHAMGNHEYRAQIYPEVYPGMYDAFVRRLREYGIHVLDNQEGRWRKGSVELRICGFSLEREYYQRFHPPVLPADTLKKLFGAPDPKCFNILLAHNPYYMDHYMAWKPELTLCGHYHGGIVRLGEHRGLITPDFRLFSGRTRGYFEKDGSGLYIGSGLGEHTLPIRINNPRELVIIDLLPEKT